MSERKPHDVFVSYAHKDRSWATAFTAALRRKSVGGIFDGVDLGTGASFSDELESALRESRVLIPILSAESDTSPWVLFEIGAAVAGHKQIIPVMADRQTQETVPAFLERYCFVAEPDPELAARRVARAIIATEDRIPAS